MAEPNKPQRLFGFLEGLTALTRQHGIVIEGAPKLEFKDQPQGMYCINPNNAGPEFGWNTVSTKS
jgi:hypothetical protein